MRIVWIAAVALLLLVTAALSGVGRPEAVQSAENGDTDKRSVTVSGSSFVTAVPDRASFTFGVEGRGETASEALSESAAAIKRVVDALKRSGVDGDDIQTQQVSLNPLTSMDGRHIEGYAANASVLVRVNDLDRAGPLVDAAVAAGANTVYGPSLERSDQDELVRDALAGAFADARSKAEALAEAAGASLGQVLSVSESGAPTPMPYDRMALAEAATDVSIEPGKQEFHASVTVTFELG
ncbi:MAG: SIMPL domain-containing protein [Gaiellaceae bacterium]